MAHKPSLHDRQMQRIRKAVRPQRAQPPKAGLVGHRGVTFVYPWGIPAEELTLIRGIWRECLWETVGAVLPGVKTACLEWVGLEGKGPWEAGKIGEATYGLLELGPREYVRTHALARVLAGFPDANKENGGKGQQKWISAHLCDNKRCCNPEHLVWKTYEQNAKQTAEAKKKGEWTPTPYAKQKQEQQAQTDFFTNWLKGE